MQYANLNLKTTDGPSMAGQGVPALDARLRRWLAWDYLWSAAPLWRYGLGVVLIAAALVVRWSLFEVIGESGPYIFIFPTVTVTAVLAGFGPAVLATILGVLATEYFFVGPVGIGTDPATVLRMVMILLCGLMLGYIGYGLRVLQVEARAKAEALRAKMEELATAEEELRAQNDELVTATEALRLSEEKFAKAFANNPAAVTLTRLEDGEFLDVNDTWTQLLGYARNEAVGLSAKTLPIWPTPEARARFVRELREKGALRGWEQELLKRSGEAFVAQLSAQILDVGGEALVLSTLVDITDRQRAETALKRFNQELEQRVAERTSELAAAVEELKRSNEDLERFAWISSHDLQEPVRMVSMYTGMLGHKYKGQLDAKADQYIAFAMEGAQRMGTLIKDLLAFSRVNTQGKPPEPTDTAALLQRILAALHLRIAETRAKVTVDALPTVPADAAQLGLVFQNLIENAIKYRRDDEPPKVHVSANLRDGRWFFNVRDNGIGIDPQFHEQVFVAFKRLHADRSKYPGSGIGLAIVKRIIERHHGRVGLESKPGEGSTFFFTLPAGDH